MPTERSGTTNAKIVVCVIERSPLAVSQLRRVLRVIRDVKIVPRPEDYRGEAGNNCVFVIDRGTLPVPLVPYLFQIQVQHSSARILVIDQDFDKEELTLLLSAGVHGVLTYDEIDGKLVRTIYTLASGHLGIPQEILEDYVVQSVVHRQKKRRLFTTQEQRIVELVKQRLSNKEIAAVLQISESTVKFHLSNIFGKLGVRTRDLIPDCVANPRTNPRSACA
jgi:DNA-binding NarL/FixJ family response regulator